MLFVIAFVAWLVLGIVTAYSVQGLWRRNRTICLWCQQPLNLQPRTSREGSPLVWVHEGGYHTCYPNIPVEADGQHWATPK